MRAVGAQCEWRKLSCYLSLRGLYPCTVRCPFKRLNHVQTPKFGTKYRGLVGSLLYAAVVSNPDISYTVSRRWKRMLATTPPTARRLSELLNGTP